MEDFANIITFIVDSLKIKFTLWGFEFSLWSVFIWTVLASLTIWTLKKIFGGDD